MDKVARILGDFKDVVVPVLVDVLPGDRVVDELWPCGLSRSYRRGAGGVTALTGPFAKYPVGGIEASPGSLAVFDGEARHSALDAGDCVELRRHEVAQGG